MDGIKDTIQQNYDMQQINQLFEELHGNTENMQETIQKNDSIFDESSVEKKYKNIQNLIGLTIGAGITSIASAKTAITIFNKLPENQVSKVNKAIDEVLNKRTNLSQKGVKILNLTSLDAPELKKYPKWLNVLFNKKYVKGKNAGFGPFLNEIVVNREKMALSTFHEMGHAYNFNNSKILSKIQKHTPLLMAVAIGAATLPLFIKETKFKKELLYIGEKIKNGIRKAAPIIAGAAFLPILAEEGIASLNASKFAKPLLEKGVYRRMVGGNICGFATYLLSMLSLIGIAQLYKTVSDETFSQNAQ